MSARGANGRLDSRHVHGAFSVAKNQKVFTPSFCPAMPRARTELDQDEEFHEKQDYERYLIDCDERGITPLPPEKRAKH